MLLGTCTLTMTDGNFQKFIDYLFPVTCLDSIRPVSLVGAECHHTGLTRAALLELATTDKHAQRISAEPYKGRTGMSTRRNLQLDLVRLGYLSRSAGGWLRITQTGRDVQRGKLCRDEQHTVHSQPILSWVSVMCDMRPLSWARTSGAVTSGRFSKLCS